MKKTPLAKHIDKMSKRLDYCNEMITRFNGNVLSDSYSSEGAILSREIKSATELLEEERQNLIEAHYEGGYNTNGSPTEAEKYFNENYQQ